MQAAGQLLDERITLLLAALLLSMFLSGRLRPKAPAQLLTRMVERLSSKLNRAHRSSGTRVYRGMILVIFLGVVASGLALALQWGSAQQRWLVLAQIVMMAYLIPIKHLHDEVAALTRAVRRENLPEAMGLSKTMARRESEPQDTGGLLRIGVEYLAENWNDTIVAACLWYLVLGLPGLVLLRLVHFLDGQIGYLSPEYRAFGWTAAKLDDVMQYLPARLAALYLVLAALFIPKGKPALALMTLWRQSGDTASPNAGWPLSAMAGALDVSLCGPRRVKGALIEDAWIGRGSARIRLGDMRRARMLYLVACLLLFLSLAVSFLLLSVPVNATH